MPLQSFQDFSAQIKARYPQYSDMDDLELAQQAVKQFPQLSNRISFSRGDIFDQISDQKPQGDIFDRISSQPIKAVAQGPVFTSPHDVLGFGRSADNADEYTDPKDQELFRNVFSQQEPPELAQLHQSALDEQKNMGFWQKHFGSSPATDAYSKARYSYEDQLQKQFDTQRVMATAGPMHPSIGGVQAPNPIFQDEANRIAQEEGETQFYRQNNPAAYIAQHPVKATYKAAARMISPVPARKKQPEQRVIILWFTELTVLQLPLTFRNP